MVDQKISGRSSIATLKYKIKGKGREIHPMRERLDHRYGTLEFTLEATYLGSNVAVVTPKPHLDMWTRPPFIRYVSLIIFEKVQKIIPFKEKIVVDLSKTKDMDGWGLQALIQMSSVSTKKIGGLCAYIPSDKKGPRKTRKFLFKEARDDWYGKLRVYESLEDLSNFLSKDELEKFRRVYLGEKGSV